MGIPYDSDIFSRARALRLSVDPHGANWISFVYKYRSNAWNLLRKSQRMDQGDGKPAYVTKATSSITTTLPTRAEEAVPDSPFSDDSENRESRSETETMSKDSLPFALEFSILAASELSPGFSVATWGRLRVHRIRYLPPRLLGSRYRPIVVVVRVRLSVRWKPRPQVPFRRAL